MNCHVIQPMLSAYIDGEVQKSDAEMIKAHLSSCPACARELDHYRHTIGALASVEEIEPPALLLEQIELATVRRPAFGARLRGLVRMPECARWAAAGVVASGVLIGMLIARPGDLQMPAPPPALVQEPPTAVVAEPPVTEIEVIEVTSEKTISKPAVRRSVTRGHIVLTDKTPVIPEDLENDLVEVAPKVQPHTPASVMVSIPDVPDTDDIDDVDDNMIEEPAASVEEVVVELPRPEKRDTRIVRSDSPDIDTRLRQQAKVLEELRSKIASRHEQTKFDGGVDRLEGRKLSVELASIRF